MTAKYVRDIMTSPVVTVQPQTSVARVAELMVQHNLTGVPVVKKGSVVGIVTDSDLVAQKSNIHSPQYVSALHSFIVLRSTASVEAEIQKLLGSRAEHIMTSPVVSVKSNDQISRLATKMVETKANPIPVIDNEKLVGIVSRHDLLNLISTEQASAQPTEGVAPSSDTNKLPTKPIKNGITKIAKKPIVKNVSTENNQAKPQMTNGNKRFNPFGKLGQSKPKAE